MKRVERKSEKTEYHSWEGMIQRTTNPKNPRYGSYGMRGVKVCERWRKSFDNFYQDMGPKPSPKHSVDRINNNGNYEPSNCRWATHSQQVVNRRPFSNTGIKGLYYDKVRNKYSIYKTINGKRITKTRRNLSDAIDVRNELYHAASQG